MDDKRNCSKRTQTSSQLSAIRLMNQLHQNGRAMYVAFSATHGRCKFLEGKNFKNVHESSGGTKSGNSSNIKTINDIPVSIPQRFKNDDSQSSLFRKLIQKDHFENENEGFGLHTLLTTEKFGGP